MRRRHRRAGRVGERGAAIIEAAFALPILFLFIAGMADLGMWTLNDNQATNSARDGARAGILAYEFADEYVANGDAADSADYLAISAAVERRLPDGKKIESIDVRCLDPDGTVLPCLTARPDVDRLEVEVQWAWNLVTPVAGIIGVDEGRAVGVARMSIVGLPIDGTPAVPPPPDDTPPTPPEEPPPVVDCVITNLQVSPTPVQTNGNGNGAKKLANGLTVTYTTNQADRCNALSVQFTTPAPGSNQVSAICEVCDLSSSNHKWTYDGKDHSWTAGTATVRVFNEYVTPGPTKSFQVN